MGVALGLALPLVAQVKMIRSEGKIAVDIDGAPFTAFWFGPETAKPYLHPMRSASGKIVTRGYPMEEVAGEARDHVHHQGLWFTHGEVSGTDFWANHPSQKSPKKGRVALKRVGNVTSGGKTGSIEAEFQWVDPAGKPLVAESRTMIFHSHPRLRMVDLDIRLTGIEKAHFGDTKEGTFAVRLATALEEKHTGTMVNAEGREKERSVWGKRSPWVDYWGEIEGEKLGVAILDHPANPKHPTYWHSRGYGLFAANIFGERDFTGDKTRDGGMMLEPGQTWRFRYRVVIHPQDTAGADVAGMFRDFAAGK